MTIGSTLHKMNVFLFEKNKWPTAVVGTLVILVSVYVVFRMEANEKADIMLGREEILALKGLDGGEDGFDIDIPGIDEMTQKSEVRTDSSSLMEGSAENVMVDASQDRIITGISVIVTWEDEEDRRRVRMYENQPDTFRVTITDPNGTELASNSASNQHGQQGTVSTVVNLDEDQVMEYYNAGDFEVDIIMEEAGDFEPRIGLSFFPIEDDGNRFSYEIEFMYLSKETPEE